MLFFDLLSDFQQQNALKFGAINCHPARSLIIRQGERADGIHVIIQGIVESVFYTNKDRDLCLATWGIQDFVGAPHIFGDSPQQWSARALTDVKVLHLNQDQLSELIRCFPDISICLIQALGQKGERYSELAQRLAFHTVQERLALTLLDSWKDAIRHDVAIKSLPVPSALALSRSVGSTRQAVGHAMKSLSKQGLLHIEKGRYSIPHFQALEDFIGCRMRQVSLHDQVALNELSLTERA